MNKHTNRLLMAFEQQLREINRQTLNPLMDELEVEDLEPIVRMVAQSRANYLTELLRLSKSTNGEHPDDNAIKSLHACRRRYEELNHAAQALETAIQRGYLDVKTA